MMQEMRAPNRCSSGQMNTDLGPAFLASWPRPWPAQEENCHIHICHSCLGAGLGDHAGPRQWPHQGAHPPDLQVQCVGMPGHPALYITRSFLVARTRVQVDQQG